MLTTVAYSESLDPAGAFANLAAVPDGHIKTNGDFIYPDVYNRLIGCMACLGTTGAQARISSPSLVNINPVSVHPIELDIHPGAKVHHMVSPSISIPLNPNEGIEFEENSNPAAAEQHSAVLWLSDMDVKPVMGAIHTVRFTLTAAQVVNSWEYSVMTLLDQLPIGNFTCVGGSVIADGAVAFRFVPIGGSNRPGGPCVTTAEEDGNEVFRFGNLGRWFQFNSINLPGIEILGSAAAASATYQGYMDIIAV